jgi:hypothetical protein
MGVVRVGVGIRVGVGVVMVVVGVWVVVQVGWPETWCKTGAHLRGSKGKLDQSCGGLGWLGRRWRRWSGGGGGDGDGLARSACSLDAGGDVKDGACDGGEDEEVVKG